MPKTFFTIVFKVNAHKHREKDNAESNYTAIN